MVDEIFKDMTESGGAFYKMQELQAETLKGQWSNLIDAYQLVLNEIGGDNEGLMKGSINVVKTLLENYEILIDALKTAAISFGIYKTGVLLSANANTKFGDSVLWGNKAIQSQIALNLNYVSTMKMADAVALGFSRTQFAVAKATMFLQSAVLTLRSAFMSLWPMLAIGAAFALFEYFTNIGKAVRELNEELDKISDKSFNSYKKGAENLKDLGERLRYVNQGSKEHRDLIGKINSQYKDYLPFVLNEATALNKVAESYDKITEAMKRTSMQRAFEQGKEAIEGKFDIEKIQSDLAAKLESFLSPRDAGVLVQKYREELERQLSKGIDITPSTNPNASFIKLFDEYTQGRSKAGKIAIFDVVNEVLSLQKSIEDMGRATDRLNGKLQAQYGSTYKTLSANNKLSALELKRDEAILKIEKDRADIIKNGMVDGKKKQLAILRAEQKIEASMRKFQLEKLDLDFAEGLISKESLDRKKSEIVNWAGVTVSSVNKRIEALKGFSEVEKSWITITKDAQDGGITQIIENAVSSYEQWNDISQRLQKTKAAGTAIDEKELEDANRRRLAYLELVKMLGAIDKLNKGAKKDLLAEKARERISLYQTLRSEYDKLTKAGYSYAQAQQKIQGLFGGEISRLFGDGYDAKKLVSMGEKQASDMMDGFAKSVKGKSKDAFKVYETEAGKLRLDSSVKIVEIDISSLSKSLEDIKSDYEIGLEIKSMGESGTLFSQIFGYNPADLDETVKRINEKLSDIGASVGIEIGVDMPLSDIKKLIPNIEEGFPKDSATYQSFMDYYNFRRKIEEDEYKRTVDGYKDLLANHSGFYYKLLEIERVYNEERAALDAKFNTDNLKSTSEYSYLLESITRKRNKAISGAEFDNFKEMDDFIDAFGDLGRISSRSIGIMIDKFNEFKKARSGSFSATELREFSNTIEKLDEELVSRNPFIRIASNIKKIRDASNALSTTKISLGFTGSDSEFEASRYDEIFKLTEAINEEKKKGKDSDASVVSSLESQVESYRKQIGLIRDVSEAQKRLGASISSATSYAGDMLSLLTEVGNNIFGDADTEAKEIFNDVSASFQGLLDASSGVAKIIQGDIIGGLISVFKGLWDSISTWFDNSNNRINRQLAESKARADALSESYDRLKDAISDAIGVQETAARRAAIDGLIAKRAEAERALALERSRSRNKQDLEAQRSYIREIEQIDREIADSIEEIVTSLTGTDVKSASEDFASAWMDAWMSGADTMDVISGKFDDMIDGMITKSIASTIISARMSRVFKAIEKALEDNVISPEEYESIRKLKEEQTKGIQQDMENIAEDYKIAYGKKDSKDDGLSALQKGIQGITEKQAVALESLFNSFLFQSYIHTDHLNSIRMWGEVNASTSNQLLLVARESHAILIAMRSWQESITGNGHAKFGGSFIKVGID